MYVGVEKVCLGCVRRPCEGIQADPEGKRDADRDGVGQGCHEPQQLVPHMVGLVQKGFPVLPRVFFLVVVFTEKSGRHHEKFQHHLPDENLVSPISQVDPVLPRMVLFLPVANVVPGVEGQQVAHNDRFVKQIPDADIVFA